MTVSHKKVLPLLALPSSTCLFLPAPLEWTWNHRSKREGRSCGNSGGCGEKCRAGLRIPSHTLSLVLYRPRCAVRLPPRQLWATSAVSAMCRGLHQLRGRHTVPGGGGPGTAGCRAGLSILLHASCLPGHGTVLPLPPKQGKPCSVSSS